METPLVSIVIPVYNGANFMREAIDSALNQTYSNIEVIVVNDGSNDNGETDSIAQSYGEQIRYFKKPNGGVSSALNVGIENMRGDYFSWLSHDDVYEKDKVEKQVAAINKSNDRTVVVCQYSQIDEWSHPLAGYISKSNFKSGVIYTWQEALKKILSKNTICGCCLLIPKCAFTECGLFNEELRFCQDTVMWYEIFLKGYSLLCLDDALVRSRVHGRQLTQTGQGLFRIESEKNSTFLTRKFIQASDAEYNFLTLYLFSNAKYMRLKTVKKIVDLGKKSNLICGVENLKAYIICGYGKIRPIIRRIYYKIVRKMETT